MAAQTKKFKAYFQFIGGQNSSAAPDNLADNEVRLAENLDVVVRGALKRRPGTVSVDWACFENVSGVPIDRFAEFSTATGTLVQLALAGGNLYVRSSETPILTTAGRTMDYTVYNNKLYMLIKDSYYVYDGTTLAEVTDPAGVSDNNLATIKKCKYIEARADRVYCSGNPDAPNALYFSQIGQPDYFKTGSFIVQAASGDGDVITGLREFNEALLVFKKRAIWAWFGYNVVSDVEFTKLSVHTGTQAYRTIQNVGNTLFFLGDDGVYAMRGTYSGSLATDKITTAIDDEFKGMHNATLPYENTSTAVYDEGRYYLFYTKVTGEEGQDLTVPNACVVCHVDAGAPDKMFPWTLYKGIYARAILKSADGAIYFAHASETTVFRFSEAVGTDTAGESLVFNLKTKDYDLGSPIHVKKLVRAWVALRQLPDVETGFSLRVYVDYKNKYLPDVDASESLVYDVGTWGDDKWGWIDTVTRSLKLGVKGIRVSMEILGASTADAQNEFLLYGIAFMYKVKKPYKD